MGNLKNLLGPMRVNFLLLALVCVLLGMGTAVWSSGQVSTLYVLLAFIGGVCAHISVNAFNEYFDFKSGLDLRTKRTPFSGGSGTLPENPHLAHQALKTAIFTFVLTALIGFFFLWVRGVMLLPLGLLGLLLVVVYTVWLVRSPVLCLIAPGLGFGPLMVMGTHFVLGGAYSWTAFVASLVPFFLVSNLLLLNQFPDVEADQSVGRKNLPIVIGRKNSSLVYGSFLLLTYLSIVAGIIFDLLPIACLLGLLTLVLAVPHYIGVWRHAENLEQLRPHLGFNVIINLATPVLLSIGLFVS